MSASAKSGSSQSRKPAIEWIFGLLSGILVMSLMAFFGYEAVFGDNRPARLIVSVESVETYANGTVLAVAVANGGDVAASAVRVRASPLGDAQDVPPKEIEIDYIAAHSIRRGAFVFSRSIDPGDIRLEIGGFAEP